MNYAIIATAVLIVVSGAALILPFSVFSKLRKKEDASEMRLSNTK
jgi:hypothetical protein